MKLLLPVIECLPIIYSCHHSGAGPSDSPPIGLNADLYRKSRLFQDSRFLANQHDGIKDFIMQYAIVNLIHILLSYEVTVKLHKNLTSRGRL